MASSNSEKKSSPTTVERLRAFPNSVGHASQHVVSQMARELFKPKFQLCDNEAYVGIEVEVEGILTNSRVGAIRNLDKDLVGYLWSNTEDGSLRNNGREFVSIPICGDAIEYSLTHLSQFLEKSKDCKGHEFSDRTSIHVHVNARDLTLEQLASWILLYIAVEPVLYNFCGGNRHKNIFCVPVNQAHSLEEYINYFVYNAESNSRSTFDVLNTWKKYCGFNLKPLHKYGTVEFRHMIGTMDVPKLLVWIDMLLMLRKYAKEMPLQKLIEELPNLNTTSEYSMLLRAIFGEYADMLQFSTMQRRMEESVVYLKNCLSVSPEQDIRTLLSEQKKKQGNNILKVAKDLKHMVDLSYVKKAKTKSTAARMEAIDMGAAEVRAALNRGVPVIGWNNIPEPPRNNFQWVNVQVADDVVEDENF